MCGIIGGNQQLWQYDTALNVISHRGPDGKRIAELPGITLGFVRLAIMDLSDKGMQPMFTRDGRYCIVYNGEIYAWRSLRVELEHRGYVFQSESDTEVLLYGYAEWGQEVFDKLDGMFALAIYDREKQEIVLCRDRMGIKPLYYLQERDEFAFASELKGLTSLCDDMVWDIDGTAVFDYLLYQYIPDPKTLYKQVKKLEPATFLVYDLKNNKIITKKKYWQLQINSYEDDTTINIEEAAYEVRKRIKAAVQSQLISDVPVGTFLSGGIDSSIVTAEASLVKGRGIVDAFCIGFAETDFDETPYAKKVAEHVGVILHSDRIDKNEAREMYYQLKNWFDEPFGDSTAYTNYQVANDIHRYVKVALSGDGGDEVFGGYERYRKFSQSTDVGKVKRWMERLYSLLGWDKYLFKPSTLRRMDDVAEYALISGFVYEPRILQRLTEVKKRLGIPKDYDALWHFRQFYNKELPRMTMAQIIDLNSYLSSGMLPKVDRTSMAVSLEVRVPLLDKRVVEYAFALPQNIRCRPDNLKRILKEAYKEILPIDILYRRKQGFSVPEEYFTKMGVRFKERVLRDLWQLKVIE